MDLLAPFRKCLQCLPFFPSSPPSQPRLPPAPDSASKAPPSPDLAELPQSSAVALPQEQDLASAGKKEESRPLHSSYYDEADLVTRSSSEADGKLVQQIGIPDSSSPHDAADYNEPPGATEPSLHAPFMNDVSFSTTGVLHLPIPLTPAPFGTGNGYPAGQYPPQISSAEQKDPRDDDALPKDEEASKNEEGSSQAGQAEGAVHVNPQDGHELMHHSHGGSDHGDAFFPHQHKDSDEGLSQKGSANMDDTDVLETSISTPVFLGTEIEYKRENDNADATVAGGSMHIDSYHSEPVLLDVPEDDSYIAEDGFSPDNSHPGRRRRRDHFKQQFKGFSQQIKQGGLHIKEESGKHLQTMMSNINKQAQEFEQSGRYLITPRLNKD